MASGAENTSCATRLWNVVCCCCRRKAKGTAKTADLSGSFTEHSWDVVRLASYFQQSQINSSNPQKSLGLSSVQARSLIAKNGPNALPKPKEMTNIELFLRQFLNLLWALLLTADLLSFVSYLADTSNLINLWCAIAIFVMIIGMCCISFYQEREARLVVKSFANLLPEDSTVIRDGKDTFVEARDLVVGDLIKVKAGTRVPADARLIYCSRLKLETSSITGEAEPIEYQVEPVGANLTIFEAHNVAFNGSLCVEGEGIAVVIRTGVNTIIGQIALLTTNQEASSSTLQRQMSKFVKFLVVLATTVATVAFVVGGFVHKWTHVVQLLCNGFLVCAIGMVPCGLPATVTSMITVVARRMAGKQVYLKKLDICEALGSCNIIASDKTGTLTKNIMTVTDVWYCNEVVSGTPSRSHPIPEPLKQMLDIMTVCNSAQFAEKTQRKDNKCVLEFDKPLPVWKRLFRKGNKVGAVKESAVVGFDNNNCELEEDRRSAVGSPSEVAMLHYADKLVDVDSVVQTHNVVFEVPFSSRLKWHLQIVKERDLHNGDSQFKLLIKGASEIVIKMCEQIVTCDGTHRITERELSQFEAAYDKFGSNGRRIIGFASLDFVAKNDVKFDLDAGNVPLTGLNFVGFCAIMDPPKDETATAVAQCKAAGIKVFMITGDSPITAAAIARQIGLIEDRVGGPKDWEVLCGAEINQLSAQDWDRLVQKRALVFARTTPEQKLNIVMECQKRKQIIAMTGDGVNDAPALKRADIGIAMGSGSEVAKDAADVILMNDNFASIVDGIKEGRMMFDNIKKLLGYTQLHSFPEVWPIIINFCFGMPVGISSLQILTIDLGTEIGPGVAMCKEPAEGDVMERPPRRRGKVLVSNTLLGYSYTYAGQIQSLGCFLAYCCVFWSHNINVSDLWMSAIDSWQEGGKPFISNGRTFSVEEQLYIGRQACSAWQVGIVFGQFWHIFCARTRRQSIFTHGVFRNKTSNIALVAEVVLLLCFVYVPGLNEFIGGAPVPWTSWAVVAAVGWFLILINEIRKYCIRNYPKNKVVRLLKW